jgi:hypothetical protein
MLHGLRPPFMLTTLIAGFAIASSSNPIFRDTEQRSALGTDGIHHCADVIHALFEMGDADVPVGEAGAALVEQDQAGNGR